MSKLQLSFRLEAAMLYGTSCVWNFYRHKDFWVRRSEALYIYIYGSNWLEAPQDFLLKILTCIDFITCSTHMSVYLLFSWLKPRWGLFWPGCPQNVGFAGFECGWVFFWGGGGFGGFKCGCAFLFFNVGFGGFKCGCAHFSLGGGGFKALFVRKGLRCLELDFPKKNGTRSR